jgi:hypothetical protein
VGPIAQLALRADGNSEAAGLIESMTCWWQRRPGAFPGSGRHEVRKWTLILRFADDRSTYLPLHVLSDENLQRANKFELNGRDLVRAR